MSKKISFVLLKAFTSFILSGSVLTIAGGKRESENEVTYLHQGIAQRALKLSFRLANHIEVQGRRWTTAC